MPIEPDATRDRLARGLASDLASDLARDNEEFRRLLDRHRLFEEKLERLNARHSLSDEEQVEAITLKKHELALKDRMTEILRGFQQQPGSNSGH